MHSAEHTDLSRKRAPSQRALATRERVLDAAEKVFARSGFDGATIREIAAQAGEPLGSVHHHGGGKEALFRQTVARRAETLAAARLEALDRERDNGMLTLETLLGAFLRPVFALSRQDSRWHDYARLVAYVSTDDRWRAISQVHFDPTVEVFLAGILDIVPGLTRQAAAEGLVFSVSAMLALLTSQKRIAALGGGAGPVEAQVEHLVRFCAAGLAVSDPSGR